MSRTGAGKYCEQYEEILLCATMRPAFKPAGLWYGLEPQHDTFVIERARDTVVRGPALVS